MAANYSGNHLHDYDRMSRENKTIYLTCANSKLTLTPRVVYDLCKLRLRRWRTG